MNEWMDAEARVELAHKLYEQGRWAEAAAELRAAIDANPYNAAWHFNLAVTFEAMDDFEHACDCYRAVLEIDRRDLEALTCLAINFNRLGKYDQAIETLRRAERVDPNYEPAYCNRIVSYAETDDHESAELMFYLARQVKDVCPHCYYHMGNSLLKQKHYDRAIECFRQALAADADYGDANCRIAEALWAQGDIDAAAIHYQAEIERNADDVEVQLDLGEMLIEADRLEEARDVLAKALLSHPDSASAHYCMAELSMQRDRLDEAHRLLERALELDPDCPGVHMKLGQVLIKQGRASAGVRELLQELKRCGDDPDRLQELGQLLLEAQQALHANNVLRRLVEIRPTDAHAQHNLAVSYFLLDRIDEGLPHCRRALRINPEYPLALYNLALAHMQRGESRRARRCISRALTVAPDDPQIQALSKRLGVMRFWTRLRGLFSRRSGSEAQAD